MKYPNCKKKNKKKYMYLVLKQLLIWSKKYALCRALCVKCRKS